MRTDMRSRPIEERKTRRQTKPRSRHYSAPPGDCPAGLPFHDPRLRSPVASRLLMTLQSLLEQAIPQRLPLGLAQLVLGGGGRRRRSRKRRGRRRQDRRVRGAMDHGGRRLMGRVHGNPRTAFLSHWDGVRGRPFRLDDAPRQQALRVKQDIAGLNRRGQKGQQIGSTSASLAGS